MRSLVAIAILVLSGCADLVSTTSADFPKGYATLDTTSNFSRAGKACHAGTITYFKRNALAQEHWVASGPPYYAAPGTYRIAMWCQAQVDPQSGECRDNVYIDSGGPESKVTLESNRTYVVYCSGAGIKVEDQQAFDRSHKQ
jgi:hypothetical protein